VAEAIFAEGEHPALGIRSCLGLLRLGEQHGIPSVEAACQRAVSAGVPSYLGVQALLAGARNTAGGALTEAASVSSALVSADLPSVRHDNIRGADYYDPPVISRGGSVT
jgi:hypothetical protein